MVTETTRTGEAEPRDDGLPPRVRVSVVPETEATGEVAELYEELRGMFFGFVPDVFKLVSTRPDMLRTFVTGFRSMFDGGHLSREAKEVVAITVARVAGCQYCTAAHDALLRLIGAEGAMADAVAAGRFDDQAIPDDLRALASLAELVTRHAYRITDDHLAEAAAQGWSEAQLLEAIWVACLFNGIVRLADTLGLYELNQLADA